MIPITGGFGHWQERVRAGRVRCPGCGGPLSPRGYAPPLAPVRGAPQEIEGLGPGGERIRAWCRACRVSHTLLPAVLVSRRADTAEAIGEAVTAHVRDGHGAARIAAQAGVPRRTVSGWLAQAASFAARYLPRLAGIASGMAALPELCPLPSVDAVREMLFLLAVITATAARRYGRGGAGYWERVNVVSCCRFLSASGDLYRMPDYRERAVPGIA